VASPCNLQRARPDLRVFEKRQDGSSFSENAQMTLQGFFLLVLVSRLGGTGKWESTLPLLPGQVELAGLAFELIHERVDGFDDATLLAAWQLAHELEDALHFVDGA